jgi:hypothetical protein
VHVSRLSSHDALAMLDINFIGALTVSALLLAWIWARRRGGSPSGRAAKSGKPAAADASLDTVQSWTPQAVRVLTLPERQAYDPMRKAMQATGAGAGAAGALHQRADAPFVQRLADACRPPDGRPAGV